VDQTDEARPTREAGDTSVEVGLKMASRVSSRESRMIPEKSMESIYQQLNDTGGIESIHSIHGVHLYRAVEIALYLANPLRLARIPSTP
jgi:hypothetical protein